jgi:hypothetical protein
VKPVTLLDGRAKFVTTPLITGSFNNTNTIGIVLVARHGNAIAHPAVRLERWAARGPDADRTAL